MFTIRNKAAVRTDVLSKDEMVIFKHKKNIPNPLSALSTAKQITQCSLTSPKIKLN